MQPPNIQDLQNQIFYHVMPPETIRNNEQIAYEDVEEEPTDSQDLLQDMDQAQEPEFSSKETSKEPTRESTFEPSTEEQNSSLKNSAHPTPTRIFNSIRERYTSPCTPPHPLPPFSAHPPLPPPKSPEQELNSIIEILSSKLLSQILSAGDLFHTQIAAEQREEGDGRDGEASFDRLVSQRVFLADVHEKVEKAILEQGVVQRDPGEDGGEQEFGIEEVDLEAVEQKLQDAEVLEAIFKRI
mmetsp:Transcript_15008/g.17329  ORF Transcript_15008/g.17329 Transcript_15008/m.17329 type:complete len:241 (+) Transcript_15008:424-1146(+)